MNSNNKNYFLKQKDIKSHLNLIKNKYILKQLFIILPSKIFLEIIKYNKEIQKKLNIDRLEKVNANIVGVVLNKFKTKDYKNYGYYGYYEYDDNPRKFKLFGRKK